MGLTMRASRLLHILLLLQNRGKLTAATLATELEVTRRTILRDVDALTEAGLPIIVHQGYRGGIELGFGYRTRLTGLNPDEAEALGVMLGTSDQRLEPLGLGPAWQRARSKLLESLPDFVRDHATRGANLFQISGGTATLDTRLPALAQAVRNHNIVRIRARTAKPTTIHPILLFADGDHWWIKDNLSGQSITIDDCGDIAISAHQFAG